MRFVMSQNIIKQKHTEQSGNNNEEQLNQLFVPSQGCSSGEYTTTSSCDIGSNVKCQAEPDYKAHYDIHIKEIARLNIIVDALVEKLGAME